MTAQIEPGSFRDRQARVYMVGDRVLRGLSPSAHEDWKALEASSFFADAVADGRIIRSREIDLDADSGARLPERWTAVLEHDRIPFVSYPYEWTFSMLKDAALLQMDLLLEALAEDLVLKDSSSYNIQFFGTRPVHIDIPSFQRLAPGEPWVGYLQFCQLFLYPLFLAAYKDLPFQPWLRGAIDGITPADCQRLMSLRDHFRSGVFSHVYLQSKLQSGTANASTSMKDAIKDSGFVKSIIVRNATKMRALVGKLEWRAASSEWAEYASEHSYSSDDEKVKQDFVARAAGTRSWNLAWDLGCNTGTYSRIIAEHSSSVVAVDGDQLAVDRLYRQLKSEDNTTILPLTMNLADPPSDLGWRGRERRAFTGRGQVDLILCLALVHHMVITANVPLAEFVEWLAGLGAHLVIEFVTKDDAMVAKLLLNKEDIYDDYTLANFEGCLARHFQTLDRHAYHDDTRVLFFVAPKSP